MKTTGLLRGLPGWQAGIRAMNREEPADVKVHVFWALAVGVTLGIVVATTWWSSAVDEIVERQVAAQLATGRR